MSKERDNSKRLSSKVKEKNLETGEYFYGVVSAVSNKGGKTMKEPILKPCPFCNGKAKIIVSDDEGNNRPDEYENDPWSGLTFKLNHPREQNKDCPIANYDEEILGTYLYESREEVETAWNTRHS